MNATEETIERLFAVAIEARKWLSRAELEFELEQFGSGDIQRCHDWRNHIPDAVAEEWEELPLLAKLVAFIPAAVFGLLLKSQIDKYLLGNVTVVGVTLLLGGILGNVSDRILVEHDIVSFARCHRSSV